MYAWYGRVHSVSTNGGAVLELAVNYSCVKFEISAHVGVQIFAQNKPLNDRLGFGRGFVV